MKKITTTKDLIAFLQSNNDVAKSYIVVGDDDNTYKEALKYIKNSWPIVEGCEAFAFKNFTGNSLTNKDINSTICVMFPIKFHRLIIIKQGEKITSETLKNIATILEGEEEYVHMFIGASGSFTYRKFLEDISSTKVIVCDFREKNPWMKTKTCIDKVIEYCKNNDKIINRNTAQSIVNAIGHDTFALSNEINKIATYLGDKPTIDDSDIKSLEISQVNVWDISDAIIAREFSKSLKLLKTFFNNNSNSHIMFVTVFRKILENSLMLISAKNQTDEENIIKRYLPNIPNRKVVSLKTFGKYLGKNNLERALTTIFNLDILLRNSSFNKDSLVNIFLMKILYI